MASLCYSSPIGTLGLFASNAELVSITFGFNGNAAGPRSGEDTKLLHEAAAQLDGYFSGERKQFDLPLRMQGSDFQRRVWTALQQIPYGQTISYRDLAERIGNPNASRAVGLANGANPLPIVVPCHRVIASDGSLAGFAGGIQAKSSLLELERAATGLFATGLQ